jgi:hypothetical protein
MLSLLAGVLPTILGILSSTIPNFVQYLEKGQSYKHEQALVKLQMEAAKEGLDYQLIATSIKAVVDEGESLRRHDIAFTDSRVINVIRASVRPFLTIFFFLFFIGTKSVIIWLMMENHMSAQAILGTVWDDYTSGIFGAIVGFWFGSRMFLHLSGKAKPI